MKMVGLCACFLALVALLWLSMDMRSAIAQTEEAIYPHKTMWAAKPHFSRTEAGIAKEAFVNAAVGMSSLGSRRCHTPAYPQPPLTL